MVKNAGRPWLLGAAVAHVERLLLLALALIYVFLVGVSSLEAGGKIFGEGIRESLYSAAANQR